MARLFVAVKVGPEIEKNLADFQEQKKPQVQGVSWVRSEGLHVTLKFLGERPESLIPDLRRALDRAVHGTAPFRLTVTGTGAFPDRDTPRVLWAGVTEGTDELTVLSQRVDDVLVPLGIPREERKFHPHVTLGRVKGRVLEGWEAFSGAAQGPFGSRTVNSIILMKSELTPQGALYSPIEEFPLEAVPA
jgi:2'-5' RNA ligase